MQPGTRLNHYEIVSPLGEGVMGRVYRAEDTRLKRQVAIKVLPAELAGDPDRLARLEREAQVLAQLEHPNVAGVYGLEEAQLEGRTERFLVMQLAEGETLADRLTAGPLPLEETVEIARQLALGLEAAHACSIVHRDLKPANVMLGVAGEVKLLDFGLAKAIGAEDGPGSVSTDLTASPTIMAATGAGVIMGTAPYMSPEQAQGHAVDARSDVFSLGIVLYEMATGVRPFTGDGKISVLSAIIKDQPDPVVRCNPAMPRHLGRIIAECLRKDPTRRYQSALGLRNDLQTLAQEVRSGEVEAFSLAAASDAATERGRGVGLRQILAAVVLVALAAAAVFAGQWLPTPAQVEFAIGSATQITRASGLELDPALSPDGEMVAYVSGPQGQMRLFVRSVAGGRAIPLAEDFPGNHRVPRWSPDGSRIAFSTRDAIWTVPPLGGVPRQVSTGTSGQIRGLD